MDSEKVAVRFKTHSRKTENSARLIEFVPRGLDAHPPKAHRSAGRLSLWDETRLMQSRARSGQYRRLLYATACRVLNSTDGAREALQNCLLRASYHPSRFASEGAFRSWLIRVLIDEALLVLQKKRHDAVLRQNVARITWR